MRDEGSSEIPGYRNGVLIRELSGGVLRGIIRGITLSVPKVITCDRLTLLMRDEGSFETPGYGIYFVVRSKF